MRLVLLALASLTLAACSSAIHHKTEFSGKDAASLSLDARQRVILSQYDPKASSSTASSDPLFRRFCAEPSPDVFTVLGVGTSGGLDFTQGKTELSAALQGAFSSSETGVAISRTQTINMLREMMFRTCERYLSGAITKSDFAIIAARDQRVMVSVLAIEQLTGSIRPPSVAVMSTANASSGLNATEVVKLLATKQEELATAETDLEKAKKAQTDADTAAATCETLAKKKEAGTPTLTADETAKLKACTDAKTAVSKATATRDLAKANYDDLVAASKKGLGVSSTGASGKVEFENDTARTEAVTTVTDAVKTIVLSTFNQDETQLLCVKILTDTENTRIPAELYQRCVNYVVTKVRTDEAKLALTYKVPVANVATVVSEGERMVARRVANSPKLHKCAIDPNTAAKIKPELDKDPTLKPLADAFIVAAKQDDGAMYSYLEFIGDVAEAKAYTALNAVCGLGEGA